MEEEAERIVARRIVTDLMLQVCKLGSYTLLLVALYHGSYYYDTHPQPPCLHLPQILLTYSRDSHFYRTMATRYEWTTAIPDSPFYNREYDWFGQAQVHSCALCNEELHRAPDGVAGESNLDLLAKKFIHHHFIGVRHENNLKELIDVARSTCNTNSTAASQQGKISSLFKPTGITCIASTQTQTNGITRREPRSNHRSHNKTPTCKICASLLHVVGTKADGSFLMSASHLEQLHHKTSTVKFQELAEKETRLIMFKKPGSSTTIAATTLEISAAHDLPTDIGMSILRFVGIQEKGTTISTRSTETRRTTS